MTIKNEPLEDFVESWSDDRDNPEYRFVRCSCAFPDLLGVGAYFGRPTVECDPGYPDAYPDTERDAVA